MGRLGPAQIGVRVVVRRILPGQQGPTGSPAMTDVLGVMETWQDGRTTIRREDGSVVDIETAHIVSGKPVPPRPSRFTRFTDDEVERRAAALFRPVEVEACGDWLFRFAGGTNGRPNSILPIGSPGVDLDVALERADSFYADRGRRPAAQVVVGSPQQIALEQRGWVKLRPDEADTDVLLASVAQLARKLGAVTVPPTVHADAVTLEWLVGNPSAQTNFGAVERSLRLDDAVFTSISEAGSQVARGRANLVDDWVFFADLTVQPGERRRGLALAIMADITEWAAERGAAVMLLQVVGDNVPTQSLYSQLGFERHHSYRHLTPPDN